MTTYQTLDEQLTGRNHNGRKLGNNTYAERRGDDIAVRLHSTDVVTFTPDGSIVLDSGGWRTVTTKERMNRYIPAGWILSCASGVWYLGKHNAGHYRFADGITIHPDDTVTGAAPDTSAVDKVLKKDIAAYAKACAEAIPLPTPNGGDCWYCLMRTETGDTLGEATHDTSHLTGHMDDGYIVPALVWTALERAGYAPERNLQYQDPGQLAAKAD